MRVKVLWRSDLRQYGSGGGGRDSGMMFRAQLVDSEGSELSAVAFNAQAERLHAWLPPDTVVIVSRGALRPTVSILHLACLCSKFMSEGFWGITWQVTVRLEVVGVILSFKIHP